MKMCLANIRTPHQVRDGHRAALQLSSTSTRQSFHARWPGESSPKVPTGSLGIASCIVTKPPPPPGDLPTRISISRPSVPNWLGPRPKNCGSKFKRRAANSYPFQRSVRSLVNQTRLSALSSWRSLVESKARCHNFGLRELSWSTASFTKRSTSSPISDFRRRFF